MIAQKVMRSLNIGKCWRKGHIISYEILCPKFALVNAMFCQIIRDSAKAGCHLMVLHWVFDSFKICTLFISVFLFYFLSVLLIRFASIAFRADSIFASLSFWAFCSSIRSWNSVFFRLSTLLFMICSQILEKNNRVIFEQIFSSLYESGSSFFTMQKSR